MGGDTRANLQPRHQQVYYGYLPALGLEVNEDDGSNDSAKL
jgi:hypothetical protein